MSEQKAAEDSPTAGDDPELDALLETALADFSAQADDTKAKEEPKEATEEPPEWSDEFIQQTARRFQQDMTQVLANFGGEGQALTGELQDTISKLTSAAAQLTSSPESQEGKEEENAFAAAISQTIKGLSEGAESLPGLDVSDLFGKMQLDGENPMMQQFFQGIMTTFLSKDVLYPGMKEISEKYPEYLENKKDELPAADMERYKKQLALMNQICEEFEKETDTDTFSMKQDRLNHIYRLLDKMSEHGLPPPELVGSGPVDFPLDRNGLPILPMGSNPNQCTVA